MSTEDLILNYGINPVVDQTKNLISSPSISDKLQLNIPTNTSYSENNDADFDTLQRRHADGKDDLLETEIEDFDEDSDSFSTSYSTLSSSQVSSQNSQEFLANAETQLPEQTYSQSQKTKETNSSKLNQILSLLNKNFLPQQEVLEKQTNSLIANQRHITHKINELTNEVQRSKLFTKGKINELIKDNIDREYERCNIVVYDLPIGNWKNYLSIYKNPQKAVFALGLKFVRDFMDYDHRDLTVSKLVQKPKEGESNKKNNDHKFFRILLKLATPDDALRLKKRCFKKGFYTLRNGLTRKEREICTIIQQRVDSWNQSLGPESETMFVRKFLFNIAEVKRNNEKNVVKWHESLESAEQYFESKLSALAIIPVEMSKPSSTLPKPVSKASDPLPQRNLRNEWLPNLETPGTKPIPKRSTVLPDISQNSDQPPAIVLSDRKPQDNNSKSRQAELESLLGPTPARGLKRTATSPTSPLSPHGKPPHKKNKRGRKPLSTPEKKARAKISNQKRALTKKAKLEEMKKKEEDLAKKQKEAEDAVQRMMKMSEELERLRAASAASGHKDPSA